jgi:ABC-2 type transport system permease protein
MKTLWGVIRYEYGMSVRRWGYFLAYGLLFLFYGINYVTVEGGPFGFSPDQVSANAATMTYALNLLMPVVGGILAADRLVRDEHLRVKELLDSTTLTRFTYILGKYLGVLFSLLTPVLILLTGIALMQIFTQIMPLAFLGYTWLAFLAISVPAYAFITAFSLACPTVMPVRVYQVLFTGYWFWGNFLNPEAIPTLNGTLLTAGGSFAMEGFFGGSFGFSDGYTAGQAWLNLLVLAGCILLALGALERLLAWRASRA